MSERRTDIGIFWSNPNLGATEHWMDLTCHFVEDGKEVRAETIFGETGWLVGFMAAFGESPRRELFLDDKFKTLHGIHESRIK